MAFLHGVEFRYNDVVPRSVRLVESAAIALVGTAPIHRLTVENRIVNDPVRSLSDTEDAVKAGAKGGGFTIPATLDTLRDHGAGLVDFINVFDPAVHKLDVAATQKTFTGRSLFAGHTELTALTVKNQAATVTYVLGTDYTYDAATGVITSLTTGAIASGATVTINYSYANLAAITATTIIGGVDAGGQRTGLQAVKDIYGLRGIKPKILIAPGYSELSGVAAEMQVLANSLRLMALIDAPAGTDRDEAIAGRNGTAPVAHFQTANPRAILCFPHVYGSDGSLYPLSQFVAGVIAETDATYGYWWSPSNKPIRGMTRPEVRLTADFTDPNTEVNQLNAQGIVTVYSDFGTGFLLWGNRSASYPSDGDPLTFICVQRALDIFAESLQRASLPFVDRPITDPLIDAIVATGQGFISEQVALGALIEGSRIFYEPTKNPTTALAAGRITFTVTLMFPTPAETIIYEGSLDIDLLAGLGQEVA